MLKKTLMVCIGTAFLCSVSLNAQKKYQRKSKQTITPIELDHGESITYTREDGEKIVIELISTSANVLYTNKDKIPSEESGNDRGNMYRARLLYEFACEVQINGIPMIMRRYVGSQESFYEPYVVDGVRIWFDGVSAINEKNGGFLNTYRSANGIPKKNARFVFQDMDKRICPGEICTWFKDGEDKDENFIYKENFIDIGRCYSGDDCFMGAYLGGEAHGALDVDMRKNTLLYMPFDVDTQEGIRAKGSKKWADGSEWLINTGHIGEKYVPDNTPVKAGTLYGRGAARVTGFHSHSHFGFQIYESGVLYDIDTWIIFWQHFEDNKKRDGKLRAMMSPLSHSATEETIKFRSVCCNTPNEKKTIKHYWDFGDGGWSSDIEPKHIYSQPGIYPVTLVIDNGVELSSFTQHITIEGSKTKQPSLVLSSESEPAFRLRPVENMDVYSWPVKMVPHTLEFLARPSRPEPNMQTIHVNNLGSGKLDSITCGINYKNNKFGWLKLKTSGEGNQQIIEVGVNSTAIPSGKYEAIVSIFSEGALNSPQQFRVVMNVPGLPANSKFVIVDDKGKDFYCTPYFWIGHRYHGWGWPELKNAEGYNHFYLINGERNRKGEFARFNPDLEAGTYELWLYEKTPFASGPPADNEPARFQVRIAHANGDTVIWMEPERTKGLFPRPHEGVNGWDYFEPQPTRKIGKFNFKEGKDGFVEILSDESSGQVIVDAVRFIKKEE